MPNAESEQAKMVWYLVALYLADIAGLLDGDKKSKVPTSLNNSA